MSERTENIILILMVIAIFSTLVLTFDEQEYYARACEYSKQK